MFIESQADLIIDFLVRLRSDGVAVIEPKVEAQEHWAKIIQDISDKTLFREVQDSWYVGGNIPGKKREALNYLGGMDRYAEVVTDAFKDYSKFRVDNDNGKGAENGDVQGATVPPCERAS